jgi:hypothetical protein
MEVFVPVLEVYPRIFPDRIGVASPTPGTHFRPVAVVESAARIWLSVPTGRINGVSFALAEIISPLAAKTEQEM